MSHVPEGLLDLADTFNTFYSSGHKIISDDAALSAARVTVCRALLGVLEVIIDW